MYIGKESESVLEKMNEFSQGKETGNLSLQTVGCQEGVDIVNQSVISGQGVDGNNLKYLFTPDFPAT